MFSILGLVVALVVALLSHLGVNTNADTRDVSHTVVKNVQVTRPADTSAYADNDAVSDSTSAPTVPAITGAAKAANHGGLIVGLTFARSDTDVALAAFDVYVFDTTFTGLEDNAAFDASDAEMLTCVGIISIAAADWKASTTGAFVRKTGLNIGFVSDAANKLYIAIVAKAAYVPASAEVFSLNFDIVQD